MEGLIGAIQSSTVVSCTDPALRILARAPTEGAAALEDRARKTARAIAGLLHRAGEAAGVDSREPLTGPGRRRAPQKAS